MRFLPSVRHLRTEKIRIDILGAVLITVVLGGLQLCVENFPQTGLTERNLTVLAVVILGAAALYWCERQALHPMIPLDLFKDHDLVMLFLMSVIAGFVMFSLLFFTPLLLQGGFGLSPQLAGLLATPLAAFIAVGSVVNTRIIVRMKRPALTLTIGFSLMLYAAGGVMATQSYTPHWFLVTAVMCAGVGLGFTLNNLNIFAQNIAGRQRFGIATALMQSSRMVGGMFGTSLIGTLVTHSYESGVTARLDRSLTSPLPQSLADKFRDPQLLVDPEAQKQVLLAMSNGANNGRELLAAARDVLVNSVHLGMLLTAVAAFVAVLLSRRVIQLKLNPDALAKPSAPH